MHRLFIPPEWIEGSRVSLRGEVVHRLSRVLRMTPGDEVLLLDNLGKEYLVRLVTLSKEAGEGEVLSISKGSNEPRVQITLCQGVLKGKKLEWVLQKGTELGIAAFVPLICHRSIPTEQVEKSYLRLPRWRKIITEAAEQSGRTRLPLLVTPTPFEEACRTVGDSSLGLIPWEEMRSSNLKEALRQRRLSKVYIFIGPEGGFQEEEVSFACAQGIIPVSLGRRILRAETAGLVAATAVLYEAGELAS